MVDLAPARVTLPRLIGLTGRKFSGKNTAADVFSEFGYTQISFAGPLKAMLANLLTWQGCPVSLVNRMINGDLKETPTDYLAGRSPRHAMQTLGTEWGRGMMQDDIWVQVAMRAATSFPAVVITDVRFPNEVVAIRRAGGHIYRINRPGLVSGDDHTSEAYIDQLEVDQDVVNVAPSADEFQIEVARIFFDLGPSEKRQ